MRVLVGCEYSGRVRDAFLSLGHDAISCDLLPTDSPGPHYQGDIFEIINWPLGKRFDFDNGFGGVASWFADGTKGNALGFDLAIFHPPCTHLAVSGARWFKDKKVEQEEALEFVKFLMNCDIPKIALENPVSVISSRIRKPDQIIQPWQFGHGEVKATCLWLKNLPKLVPDNIVDGREAVVHRMPPSEDRWKKRSLTYMGVAEAMASQWGDK